MKNVEKLFISKFAAQKEKTVAMATPSVPVTKPAPVQKKPNTGVQRQRRVAQIEQPPESIQEPLSLPTQEPKKQTGKEYLRSMLTEAAAERLGLKPQTVKTVGNTLYNQRLDLPLGGGKLSLGMMDDFGPGGAGIRFSRAF